MIWLALALQIEVGRLLVATEKSHDPDLAKSVVLIVHADQAGAIGLILNRPVKDIYFGGPVALGARSLFRSASKPANAERVFGDVYVSTRQVPKARVYAGYVGWSAAQLEDEIARGLWKIRDATTGIVFDAHPERLWHRLH